MSDSQSSIAYTKDPKFHSKTKHIDIKYHYVKDMVARGEVNLKYISTYDMIADSLIKAITRDVFEMHIKYIGLRRFYIVLCLSCNLDMICYMFIFNKYVDVHLAIHNVLILNVCDI